MSDRLIEAAEALLTECRDYFMSSPHYDGADTGNLDTRCMDCIEALRAAVQSLRAAPAEPVAGVHWYCLAATGTAMLCTGEADARHEAAECDRMYPMHAPHRAVQLVPATPPTSDAPAQGVADKVRAAMIEYYKALDGRAHGAVAASLALARIEEACGMSWSDRATWAAPTKEGAPT